MINIFKNIKKNLLINKRKRDFIAASNLEKKAIQLNLKSEEYLELAKKSSKDWKNKWLEIRSQVYINLKKIPIKMFKAIFLIY